MCACVAGGRSWGCEEAACVAGGRRWGCRKQAMCESAKRVLSGGGQNSGDDERDCWVMDCSRDSRRTRGGQFRRAASEVANGGFKGPAQRSEPALGLQMCG